MRLIKTSDLSWWAETKQAESQFPYWVKRLICAAVTPTAIQFPSDAAVWLPGYDGVVVSTETNRFVPKGLSVWEVGTRKRIKGQAEDNYQKRSASQPPGEGQAKTIPMIDRATTTFVFATPLVWKHKSAWVAERKSESIWGDVVAIDGVDLEEWFEAAPAVALQFASELQLMPEQGLQIPDHAWSDWSQQTDPPASEALVLTGRGEQAEEVIRRLMADPTMFTVRGHSPREAWGFALAAMKAVDNPETRMNLLARTIIAEDEKVAGQLRNRKNLIVLLKSANTQVPGTLCSGGSHVIVPAGTDLRSERNVIALARSSHEEFTKALVSMGLQKDEAARASHACRMSVTVFLRQRAAANFERPSWAHGENATNLLPALLAGRWNSKSEGDKRVLCMLAAADNYASAEALLQDFLWVDEAPLQKIDAMWTLTAPADAFQLLARRLTAGHLARFKDAFQIVFGQVDPKCDIPPKQWLFHAIRSEGSCSEWLRCGMAETLLLIAENGLVCCPGNNLRC